MNMKLLVFLVFSTAGILLFSSCTEDSELDNVNEEIIGKWKASLNIRERSFLWFFKLLGLHKPIAAYTQAQVIPMIEATDFESFEIDERKNEIRIKLRK